MHVCVWRGEDSVARERKRERREREEGGAPETKHSETGQASQSEARHQSDRRGESQRVSQRDISTERDRKIDTEREHSNHRDRDRERANPPPSSSSLFPSQPARRFEERTDASRCGKTHLGKLLRVDHRASLVTHRVRVSEKCEVAVDLLKSLYGVVPSLGRSALEPTPAAAPADDAPTSSSTTGSSGERTQWRRQHDSDSVVGLESSQMSPRS